MVKNKIYKYFSIEILKSFITILFAFSIVAWTVRSVNFLDLIVDSGHSLRSYFLFSILNISGIIKLTHTLKANIGLDKFPIILGKNISQELGSFLDTYHSKNIFLIIDSYFKKVIPLSRIPGEEKHDA